MQVLRIGPVAVVSEALWMYGGLPATYADLKRCQVREDLCDLHVEML